MSKELEPQIPLPPLVRKNGFSSVQGRCLAGNLTASRTRRLQQLCVQLPTCRCMTLRKVYMLDQHRLPLQAAGWCLMLMLLVSVGMEISTARSLSVDVGDGSQTRMRSLLQTGTIGAGLCQVASSGVTHYPCDTGGSYPLRECCTGQDNSDTCVVSSGTCNSQDYLGCCPSAR